MEEKDLASPLLFDAETGRVLNEEVYDSNAVHIRLRNAKNILKKFSLILYAIFLVWRLFALTIYVGRAIKCCTKEAKASFQCANGIFFPQDIAVEMIWILCSIINMVMCLTFMFFWHGAAGIKQIIRKLIKLPGYWSLVFLFLVSFSGLCIMTIKNNNSFYQITSIVLFSVQNISITTTVAVLNYTRVSYFIELKSYRREVRILIKLTYFMLFLEFFSLFLISTMQFGFQVTGLDNNTKTSISFRVVFGEMRRFGEVIFYYNIVKFSWTKLFINNRNVLSYMQLLCDSQQ